MSSSSSYLHLSLKVHVKFGKKNYLLFCQQFCEMLIHSEFENMPRETHFRVLLGVFLFDFQGHTSAKKKKKS